MLYNARNLVLTTLVVTYASSALASRRHPRYYSSNHRPSFVGGDRSYRTKVMTIFPEYDTSYWPSNTDDCLRSEASLRPDSPAYYLHDGQFYDKRCLKALAYLVEPEERAVCRTQSDCRYTRGYDNECLIQLSFDQGFDFDFEEMKRQELEWKEFVCHGRTLDQCGRDHSPWWRSRFPSSRDDCRVHAQVEKRKQDASNDNWVPWSIGPRGVLYDNDCLSRFANRLGMENPKNCTQTNTYVTHEAREVPHMELPKTLLYATSPSGIQPHLVFPTGISNPDRLTVTPVNTDIPTLAGVPVHWESKRGDIPPSPVRTLTQTANILATSLPLVSRAQVSITDVDEWSCVWDVYVTLPDPASGMFDATFGGATIDKTPFATQRIAEEKLEGNECGDTA